jgi:hypothetical protein
VSDPLGDAGWWVHTLQVERYTGDGEAGGKSYAQAVPVTGFYSDKTEFSGGQIVTSGRFAFPPDVPYIPAQSRVTLPALFGGRVTQVVTVSVGDGGGQPTPDHQVVGLL